MDSGLESLRQTAIDLRLRGESSQALDIFRSITREWPQDARTHVDIALCLNALGRVPEAIAILADAVSGACASGIWHKACLRHLARFHQALGEEAASAKYIAASLARWPNDAAIQMDAAIHAATADRPDEARQHFARAESLISKMPQDDRRRPHINALVTFEWMHGDTSRAVAILTEWVTANTDPDGVRQLIFYLGRLGRGDEAFAQLYAAYAQGTLDPDEENTFVLHVKLLAQFGHVQTARLLAESRLANHPQSDAIRHLLVSLCVKALQPAAAASMLAYLENDKDSLTKAILDRQLGHTETAKAHLKICVASPASDTATRNEALRRLFYSELFALNFEAARTVLDTKIDLQPKQYLNTLHEDQLRIFVQHRHLLSELAAANDITALCKLQLQHDEAETHYGACCSGWFFITKLAGRRKWCDVSTRHIFSEVQPSPRIPRTILQYWDQRDIPHDVQETMRSWQRYYPDFDHHVLNYDGAKKFLDENHSSAFAKRFERAWHPAMRSDLFRMAWLARKGGFYIDADDGAAGRSNLFRLDTALLLPLLVAHEHEIQNNFIGAVAHHPILERYIAHLCAMPEEAFDDGLVWWLTGPGHMCRLVARHLAERFLHAAPAEVAPFHEILSTDLILVPKPLLETAMFEPRLRYKSTELSWQRARGATQT